MESKGNGKYREGERETRGGTRWAAERRRKRNNAGGATKDENEWGNER